MDTVVQPHPAILLYGQAIFSMSPLLMFVGREPNSDGPVDGSIDRYDFDRAPRCSFWNTAYGSTARWAELGGASRFKALCRSWRASPIAFSDAMPRCIRNAVTDKQVLRALITREEIERHAANLFGHDQVWRRVRLILLSGLDRPVFSVSVGALEGCARQRRLPVARIPFLYGTNARRIVGALSEEHRRIVRSVVSAYEKLAECVEQHPAAEAVGSE